MKILNVNTSLILENGGGTAERTFQMAKHLAKAGFQSKVLTLDIGVDKKRILDIYPATVVVVPSLWKRFYFPALKWKLIKNVVSESDIIHLMGHWSILNVLVYFAARLKNKPYVVCPAGSLTIFGRSNFKKFFFNFIVGKSIIRNASGWIAITSKEFQQFNLYGIKKSQITLIPNAINESDFSSPKVYAFYKRYRIPKAPIILFMGRLNLIKGPDILLNAFIKAEKKLKKFHLIFAGADEGMLEILKKNTYKANLSKRVHFIGHVNGAYKSSIYHAAKILVIPSRMEAMSIVAIEAMASGTPVLATDQCGLSDLKFVSKDLEVPVSAEKIAKKLFKLLSNQNLMDFISVELKKLALKNYTWNKNVNKFVNLYRSILKPNIT